MKFLFPLFLAGIASAAVPIVLHLMRRRTRQDVPFGSLMFLKASAPRFDSRKRIEHHGLLALRCLVLLLLAAAFARPFRARAPVGPLPDTGRRTIVLVDTSASMRRQDLWQQALAGARAAIARVRPGDRVAVMAFDRHAYTVFSFAQWAAAPAEQRVAQASAALSGLSPSWAATELGAALVASGEVLLDDEAARDAGTGARSAKRVVLISDLQEGSRLQTFRPSDWPSQTELVLGPVQPPSGTNASLQAVVASGTGPGSDDDSVRVRVTNSRDAKGRNFTLQWSPPGVTGGTQLPVEIAPGTSRVVRLPGKSVGTGEVVLRGDSDDFDNRLYLVPSVAAAVNVLYLGNDDAADPKGSLYFLQRAFPNTRLRQTEVTARRPASLTASRLGTQLASAHLTVVTAPLPLVLMPTLRDHLESGHTILWALDGQAAAQGVAALLGVSGDLGVSERTPSAGYGIVSYLDLSEPLLAPFADPRFSDFTKIHFWKYRRLLAERIPRARVLARFDDGAPALLATSVAKGTLLVLTSGWHTADSQLALSSKFVPLLQAVLEQSAGLASGQVQFFVGDAAPLPGAVAGQAGPRQVINPQGTRTTLAAGAKVFEDTSVPGVYTFVGPAGTVSFAVNVSPSESATAPMATEPLERLTARTDDVDSKQRSTRERSQAVASAQDLVSEGGQKLWRWAVALALLVIVFETLWAGRLSRPIPKPGGAP